MAKLTKAQERCRRQLLDGGSLGGPSKRKLTQEQRTCIHLVKKARRNGWTLEDLAQHLGMAFSTVSRWAAGRNVPPRNTAARMIPLLESL